VWFTSGSAPYQILYRQPLSVVMFTVLAFSLYHFARKPLKGK
jgi:hypothetical protein